MNADVNVSGIALPLHPEPWLDLEHSDHPQSVVHKVGSVDFRRCSCIVAPSINTNCDGNVNIFTYHDWKYHIRITSMYTVVPRHGFYFLDYGASAAITRTGTRASPFYGLLSAQCGRLQTVDAAFFRLGRPCSVRKMCYLSRIHPQLGRFQCRIYIFEPASSQSASTLRDCHGSKHLNQTPLSIAGTCLGAA